MTYNLFMENQISRYEENIWEKYVIIASEIVEKQNISILTKARFTNNLYNIDKDKELNSLVSIYTNLIYELKQEMLSKKEALEKMDNVLERLKVRFNINGNIDRFYYNYNSENIEGVIEFIIDKFLTLIAIISGEIRDF